MSTTQIPQVDPANPNDVTSFLASQANWSATNLPEILGRLDPPAGWSTAPKPQQLVENGRKVFRDKKAILDYDIPRYIASPGRLESWRIEAWFRTHRGLSYDDIWARQPSWVPKPTNTQKNALNQRRLREVRKPLNARAWVPNSRCPGVSKVMLEVVERLTQNEIDQNTNWTMVLGGIQQPNNPGRVLPLGTFQTNGQTHTPSTQVSDARLELQRLRVLAGSHGRGHWSELPDTLLPKTWSMRVKPRSIPTLVPIPGMEESMRGEKPSASKADSEASNHDDDGSDLASADNDHETPDQKARVPTHSPVEAQGQQDSDEETSAGDSFVLTPFNAARKDDVPRVFDEVITESDETEARVDDNTRVSQTPHLTPTNLLPQHQPYLSSNTRQISSSTIKTSNPARRTSDLAITSLVGIVDVDDQDSQSSGHTRSKQLRQTPHCVPKAPTQVFGTQAEADTANMNNEEYMESVLERQAEMRRLDVEAEQLGRDWDQLMAIPGIPADGPSTSAPFKVIPVPNTVSAFNIPADSEVMPKPYDAEALGPFSAPSPVSVLAGTHDTEAAGPASTPTRPSKRTKTTADGTVGLGEVDRQSQPANAAGVSTECKPDLSHGVALDDVPYGHGWPTDLDESSKQPVPENAAKPTAEPEPAADGTQSKAGKGRKRAREEFELDLSPEPAAMELGSSERRSTDAAAHATDVPTEAEAAQVSEDEAARKERGARTQARHAS